MNIRITDGTVVFEKGSIGREVTRRAFLDSAIGIGAEVLVDNEPYVTYRFCPEHGIAASASFMGDRLSDVTWLFEFPNEKDREWTQELELERKKKHDDWLLSELGMPPYGYAWGQITSSFDSKGCVSDIILHYGN